ncbi:MAG TPA: tetratricopeptide repeat protein [Thermoplasmata archaeon]
MACLRCGEQSEEGALICDACSEASFQEPKFFLNPILVGTSIYSRLRDKGSAALLLGPVSRSDVLHVPSADLDKAIGDLNPQLVQHDDLLPLYKRCNAILAHLGGPLKVDSPRMLLTEDAVRSVIAIVQKVNAIEKMFPLEGMSDLYIRLGIVYWNSTHGILFRTSSRKWRDAKREYLFDRAREYFSKVHPDDELYPIAERNLGMLNLEAQEWREAEEHLSNAFAHFAGDAAIGQAIARAHLGLGNHEEALSHIDETISIGETAELWVLKGKILKEMGMSNEALECFNRALVPDPRYLPAHDAIVETLRQLGRYEQAAFAESQRSLSKRPELEAKIAALVSEFKKAAFGEPSEAAPAPSGPLPAPAIAVKAEAVSAAPGSLEAARAALARKEYDVALQGAEEVIRHSPGMRDAYLIEIEALMGRSSMKEAAPKIQSFYEKNRNDPVAWYWRGELAAKEGKWGASIQYFSKAVSIDPKMADSWVSMGDVLLMHGKPSGADESYSRALQLDDDNARAWFGKAKTMRQMNRWGAAIQCLDKYTSLVPSDESALLMKADLLFEKEKWERAIEAYDAYIALSEEDSYALGRKGIALHALGRTEEAKPCLEQSVRLDSNNKEAAKWLRVVSPRGEG